MGGHRTVPPRVELQWERAVVLLELTLKATSVNRGAPSSAGRGPS